MSMYIENHGYLYEDICEGNQSENFLI